MTMNYHHWSYETGADRTAILAPLYGDDTLYQPEFPMSYKGFDTDDIHFQYLLNALKTWNKRYCQFEQINNAVLGVLGEIAEYENSRLGWAVKLDELSDIIYYRTILKYLVGDSLTYPFEYDDDVIDVTEITMLLADFAKKVLYHDKWLADKTRDRYRRGISYVDLYIIEEIANLGTNFATIYAYNVNKLSNRHGASFNPNHA